MTRHMSEAERRNQLLNAARAEFIKNGYLATRVQDIAKRAGLSKGAVYFYFASKRELFLSLVEQEHENTFSFLEQADQDARPASVKLLDLGQQYIKYFAGLKTSPRFFLMMCEQGIRDDEIRQKVHAVHQRFIEATARIHAQGVAEGTFKPLDSIAVAHMLKSMIDGIAGQSAIGLPPDPERLAGHGLQMLLHGLLAEAPALSLEIS